MKTTTRTPVTANEIRAMRKAAYARGDGKMAYLCTRALNGEKAAIEAIEAGATSQAAILAP